MRVIDSSVLIASLVPRSPHHAVARAAFTAAILDDRPAALPWVALNAVIRIVTRPGPLQRPATLDDAFTAVRGWLETDGVVLVREQRDHLSTWRRLLAAVGTGGDLTTDAWIAAIALDHGAAVLALDSDFARFPGLVWENPRA